MRAVLPATIHLALLLLPGPAAQAQFDYTTNADGVDVTITGYEGPPWDVNIPTNINGLTVTGIGEEAFRNILKLTSVTIPDSVTSIGDSAFEACYSLTSVTISANDTNIGAGAFSNCGLTNVTIPDSVTSIGTYAFAECTNLISVVIPGEVSNIGEAAFASCSRLPVITVDAQNAFYCSVNGVLFDKEQTTLIQFPAGMGGSYTIPGSVTNIELGAFFDCTSLIKVTIPDSVTTIGYYAFEGCANLARVAIPNNVTEIQGETFAFCFNLASITIGDSVTNIGFDEFLDDSLTNAFFTGNAPTVGDGAFYPGGSTTAYYLPGTTGWAEFSANTGVPAVLWNPLIDANGSRFGISNNQFGFNITGTTNIPIVVEACANLANPVWTALTNVALSNGLFYFSEPLQTNSSGRFYRITSP
jgi:hypothetical protein